MEKKTFREVGFPGLTGWPILIGILAFVVTLVVVTANIAETVHWAYWVFAGPAALTCIICLTGFFIVNPNMSRVLVLFGRYRGTVRKEGFYWTNPFTVKHVVSLRAHNLASDTVKVNDMLGNPIEIGAVVVWQVSDTALASFNVEDYQQYVDVQIETAVRELAKAHPYDEGQTDETVTTLRGDTEGTSKELTLELQERLNRAGIEVIEARISHLAYAPEIASAMLQRQQAVAIIAARQKIVEGAVGMVEHALRDLGEKGVVELDDERRATLVGNLLVVLCGQAAPQPVINAGSLYN
jgi:hypothetical protein